jgi:hypothetical protein
MEGTLFFQGRWRAVKQGKNSRRPLPSARRKLPPVGCTEPGHGRNLALFQHAHPARIVAGAGILWHTSAHKGSPLFRRWAPAPNTADPAGFPGGSHDRYDRPQVVRKPCASAANIEEGGESIGVGIDEQKPSRRRPEWPGAHTVIEGGACWGTARGVGVRVEPVDAGKQSCRSGG